MGIIYYFVDVLVILLFIQELLFIKDLKIKTKKSLWEGLIVLITIIFVAFVAGKYSKNIAHYVLGCIGILFIIVDWAKQGISIKGLLITARGKQLYKWDEIGKINIRLTDKVKVDFYDKSESKIVTHTYALDKYNKLIDTFQEKRMNYQLINQEN